MGLGDWIDERTGHRALLGKLAGAPTRGGATFAHVWGGALALCFVIMAVTGVLMMTVYQPSTTTAWSSVNYIQHHLSWGWIVRGLHYHGAQTMVVLMAVHVFRTAAFGAYKKPRELTWFFGLLLMVLLLSFIRTGYLLPWDQEGYWATRIPLNIIGTMPGVGETIMRALSGGGGYGHLTLTRFYTLHVFVLPLAMASLLAAHVWLSRKHGLTPSPRADQSKVDNYHPKQTALIMLAGLVVLGVLFALTFKTHGAPLQAPAGAASDYPARPEWYFRAPFEALKYVPSSVEWLVIAGVPAIFGGYLAALPFIDKHDKMSKRWLVLSPMLIGVLGVAALTFVSMRRDAGNPEFAKARELADQRAARAIELAADGVPPAGPLAMLALDPQTRGPELFDKHCAVCHRLNEHAPEEGKETAPDLTGFGTKAWVLAVLDNPDSDKLFGKTAFKEMMPSYTRPPKDPEEAEYFTPMKKSEQDDVAAWLVAEASGTATTGMAGEKLSKQRCTSCHRLDGVTDDSDSLAPELRGWGSLAWIRLQIANPGNGKTYPAHVMDKDLEGHMPAYGEDMTPAEINLLARWTYEQATGRKPPEK
jgi:ubiquinol-cytochrome c reductase cytochrome b subunit